ncbi:hypothetical protein [Bacillus taeanensis]|uniref:hypothetical protein n=1 Tax=Bacillus taeanensis TaxID=273032 RepID=UPI0015EFF2A7|nr:hypothetical protein [Bacillus taeanensis]
MFHFNLLKIVTTFKEIGVLPSTLFIGSALYMIILVLVILWNVILYAVALSKKTKS